MPYIAAFGNPLLDVTITIINDDLLKKYNLGEDGQKEIPASDMKSLYTDISKYPNQLSAGGCAQNTLRVLQWLLKIPESTVYFGAIGNDEQGDILTALLEAANVKTRYMIHESKSTGTCVALVKGCNRSLVANLGAAEFYNINAVLNCDNLNILKSVKIIYIEGFFLTERLEVGYYIASLCESNRTVLAFNLCGAYLFDKFPEDMVNFAKSSQIIFGNKREYIALGKILKISCLLDIAKYLSKTGSQIDNQNALLRFGKIVVITNGAKNVLCVYNETQILDFKIPPLATEKIQDTTGAGDSFVAGFFAALLQGSSLNICLKWGCWAAAQIIQESGCTIPNFIPDLHSI